MRLEKVGRLKPEGSDTIRLIIDGQGDIGVISRDMAYQVLHGASGEILSCGSAELSDSGKGFVMVVPSESGGQFVAIAQQVRNLLDRWPKKKAAVFEDREEREAYVRGVLG
jgi:hypothetical protein